MNQTKLLTTLGRACFALAGLFLAGLAPAQSASTGTIEGRVLNVTTSQYINNARVTIDGTALETFTNQSGEFRLINVPPGTAKLKVLFSGLPAQAETITVAAGQTVLQNFFLTASQSSANQTAKDMGDIIKLDAFTVGPSR